MGFLSFAKKKKVPEELPNLAVEDIKNQVSGLSFNQKKIEEADKKLNLKNQEIEKLGKELGLQTKEFGGNKSFFDELLHNVNHELKDLNSLENWYKRQFLPKSFIEEMKDHWEKEKAEIVISKLGKNFKLEVLGKIKNMQQLEKEWQNLYFELMQKEEQMKEQEKELKETLAEFIRLCKRGNKSKINKGK